MSEEIYRAVGRLESKVDALREDIKEMKPHIEDWKKTKQRGIGFGIAGLFAGSGVGATIAGIVAKFFQT